MSDARSPVPPVPTAPEVPIPAMTSPLLESQPAPQPPSHPDFWRTPALTSGLGRAAMVLGIGVLVISITLAIVIGINAGPLSTRNGGGFHFNFNVGDPDPRVNALAIAILLHVLLGTAIGLWALIQGIVATATKRGRRSGIVAIVAAGLAPGLSLIAFFVATALNLPPS